MAVIECCEFQAPILVGDTAAVITIRAGSPDFVDDIVIRAEGCDDGAGNNCAYEDIYDDVYCDATEGGVYPNAKVSDVEYTINQIPPGHDLVIDAVERTVKLVESGTNHQVGGLEALSFNGLFEWIEASGGGCMRICIDATEAHTNADTVIVSVETLDREL